jgi:dihydrofolate reductase
MNLIIARDENDGIGLEGGIPWWCPADINVFRIVTSDAAPTKKNLIIEGHVTRKSMPNALKDRVLVTMDRGGGYTLPECVSENDIDQKFIVGGRRSIELYLKTNPLPRCLVLSRISGVYDCDVSLSDDDLHLDKYDLYAEETFEGGAVQVFVLRSEPVRVPSGLKRAGIFLPDDQ